MKNLARLSVIIIIILLFWMGFIPNIPLHLVLRLLLIGHNPFKGLFNNSQDVGCLWDLPWIVGYMLSIVFIETTAMMFMDSAICSSSIEPNGIGSELEGRPEIFKMAPSGDGDREGTSSSSGNWQKFLNLASDREGDSTHEPSTSSSWSGSWIAKWFSSEISSSAPNQGGHEATNPPTEVMGPEAPSPSWLKNQIIIVLYQIKGRRTRSDVIERLWEDLRLEGASPEKRVKIFQILAEMYDNSDSLKNSRLDIHLAVSISDWERGLADVP